MSEKVLVAGIGNIFLGDDGFGPEVVQDLAAGPPLPDQVRLVDYGIRGMHLAYDLLAGYDALVLVDAVPGDGEPGDAGEVCEITAEDLGGGEFDAHGMEPVAVLSGTTDLGWRAAADLPCGLPPSESRRRNWADADGAGRRARGRRQPCAALSDSC